MATRTGSAGTLRGEEPGSAAQRDRRKRILDSTSALASKGGYDAVQMRAVADHAEVALGTLYRYFPSKTHLLISGLCRDFEQALDKLQRMTIPGDTPVDRVLYVMSRNTRAMQRNPRLTEATVRAFMFADASAAAEADHVGHLMESMLALAMGKQQPTDRDRAVFHIVADVWMANLVAWVTRRSSATQVQNQLDLTVRLLLGQEDQQRSG